MISIMSRPGARAHPRSRCSQGGVKAGSSARVRMVGQDQCKVHMHAVDVKRTRASGQGLGGVKAGSSARTVKRKRSTSVAIGGRAKLCAQMERVCMRAPRPACAEHERARERERCVCTPTHRAPPLAGTPPPGHHQVQSSPRPARDCQGGGLVLGTDWSQQKEPQGGYQVPTGHRKQKGMVLGTDWTPAKNNRSKGFVLGTDW